MKRAVVVLDPAAAEVREALAWYDAHRPGWGIRFVAEVRHALDALEEGFDGSPDLSIERLPGEPEFRRVLLRRFPFAAVFYLRERTAHVVAVAHLRRMPGYWRDHVR